MNIFKNLNSVPDIQADLYNLKNVPSIPFLMDSGNDGITEHNDEETNFLGSYEFMRDCQTLEEVFETKYFVDNFLTRYVNNIPLFAEEVCGVRLTWQQVEICNKHNPYGGRLAVPSGHGCGKTKIIGVLALHHMLTAFKSITRIQAPKLEQITKLSFGEVIANIDGLRGGVVINGKRFKNQWAFLADFIITTTRVIYVKNNKTSWYIESAVAKRGESNSLSGQHNWSYLLILDEACGIEDGHIVASLGGLSEERNSAIAFSQHANTNSMFHLFVTTLSVDNGGTWDVVRLSSVESPLVSDKALENWFASYTEDEIRVRVMGLFPLRTVGNLFALEEMNRAYSYKEWVDTTVWYSRVYTVDLAFIGNRDSSVIVKSLVSNVLDKFGVSKMFVVITDILVFNKATKLRPTEVGKKSIHMMIDEIKEDDKYYEYVQGVDATSGGNETSLVMEDEVYKGKAPIGVYPLVWGSNKRLSNKDKQDYINERAKAFIELRKAIHENRFYIATDLYKTRILREMENLPYKFDAKYRYQIEDKKDIKGGSPDILDCFAEIFILPIEDSSHINSELVAMIDERVEQKIVKNREIKEIEAKENPKNIGFSIDLETL